jgi:protein phosphatase
MISENDVLEILKGSDSLDDAAQKLIDAANQNGGRDNITVVLFRVGQDDAADEDHDTLGDEATAVGISADEVRTAVADAETSQRTVPSTTVPADVPEERGNRDKTRAARGVLAPGRPSGVGKSASRRAPPILRGGRSRGRGRVRTAITALIVLAIIAGLLVGMKALIDSRYFVGTNDAGLVTLYNGVPYDLPLGIELYDEEYVSPIPARSLPARNRERILDHQLRSKGDATDLVRQIERGRIED